MDADQLRDGAADGPERPATAIVATPVSAGASGEGLPYAPEDWPLPGDKWRWRVGLRVKPTGYFQDRYTSPPARFNYKAPGHKGWICGKGPLEKFLCEHIPNANVEEFFSSFIWKIPYDSAKPHNKDINTKGPSCSHTRFSGSNGYTETRVTPKDGECKAGNKTCHAWVQTRKGASHIIDCDVCCLEAGFCRDCCCILCCKTVDLEGGGYSFVRCQGIIDADFICGHVAHLNCALRAYLAGRVGGSIDLDAEYYCRRCDSKTNLVAHLSQFLSSKTVHSRADTERFLNMGFCILRGSEKCEAKKLHSILVSMLKKLKDGGSLVETWALGDNLLTATTGPVDEIPISPLEEFGSGDTASSSLPVPLLILSNGKEPTVMKLHEVPISFQLQDPSAVPTQGHVSTHKRPYRKLAWPERESKKKVRQGELGLTLVQLQETQTVVVTKEVKELRQVCEEDSGLKEGADLPQEPRPTINHLENKLNKKKTKIVKKIKNLRREVLSHLEARVKEAREGVVKLNNASKEAPQFISKDCKTSNGLEKLDSRLNCALGYCQALIHFHKKYPDTDISEFYRSLRRMADMNSIEESF